MTGKSPKSKVGTRAELFHSWYATSKCFRMPPLHYLSLSGWSSTEHDRLYSTQEAPHLSLQAHSAPHAPIQSYLTLIEALHSETGAEYLASRLLLVSV